METEHTEEILMLVDCNKLDEHIEMLMYKLTQHRKGEHPTRVLIESIAGAFDNMNTIFTNTSGEGFYSELAAKIRAII